MKFIIKEDHTFDSIEHTEEDCTKIATLKTLLGTTAKGNDTLRRELHEVFALQFRHIRRFIYRDFLAHPSLLPSEHANRLMIILEQSVKLLSVEQKKKLLSTFCHLVSIYQHNVHLLAAAKDDPHGAYTYLTGEELSPDVPVSIEDYSGFITLRLPPEMMEEKKKLWRKSSFFSLETGNDHVFMVVGKDASEETKYHEYIHCANHFFLEWVEGEVIARDYPERKMRQLIHDELMARFTLDIEHNEELVAYIIKKMQTEYLPYYTEWLSKREEADIKNYQRCLTEREYDPHTKRDIEGNIRECEREIQRFATAERTQWWTEKIATRIRHWAEYTTHHPDGRTILLFTPLKQRHSLSKSWKGQHTQITEEITS